MDATVNDFLKEINQISTKNEPKGQSEVWQECFDELTGYSYFWNTETDEVTWVPPKSYKPAQNNKKTKSHNSSIAEKEKKKPDMFVPPITTRVPYSDKNVNPEAKQKVYSIQEAIKKPEVKSMVNTNFKNEPKEIRIKKTPFKKPEDSDDEKIELINEYGGSDSGSEAEPEKIKAKPPILPTRKITSPSRKTVSPAKKTSSASKLILKNHVVNKDAQSDNEDDEDDDDDIDILAKIQQRAQELKKLGGEVPLEVKNIIQHSEVQKQDKQEKTKAISGFSLVAGYNSDSSDTESELPPPKPIFQVELTPQQKPEIAHSTLFPITKPIDVHDFIEPETPPKETITVTENTNSNTDFDNKAFQRKRRIGISLVNNAKRANEEVDSPNTELAGLGFKNTIKIDELKNDINNTSTLYSGFQKGGVMFLKSDVLNPLPSLEKENMNKVDEQNTGISQEQTEDNYTVLREKLLFLGEGREAVLPVQAMLIKAETLFEAMNEGGLKLSYLYRWLKETCSELVKLEKEAAPEGWLLQWDRSHKRYFYQNQVTGVSQWRYPEPDVNRCNEAMDICTTPPPPEVTEEMKCSSEVKSISQVTFGPQLPPPDPPLPPSPPKIRSPTPPPPPVISMHETERINSEISTTAQSLVPEICLPPLPPLENAQPLPPGVDAIPDAYKRTNEPEAKTLDKLSNVLDSFYSEIAEVSENAPPPTSSSLTVEFTESFENSHNFSVIQNSETFKKKKKKVKLVQGLTMKKKGVSQLVEKWKNVQKNYSD